MNGYATALTGILASMFSFDILWNCTSMEAIGLLFVSVLIGGLVACVFYMGIWYTNERKADRKRRAGISFIKDRATGLEYLSMTGGRHGD